MTRLPLPACARARRHPAWTARGRSFELGRRTHLMGIVNLTPDSFFEKSRQPSPDSALAHARRLVSEGADILDLGAESTRPGYTPILPDEELARLLPTVKAVCAACPAAVSVDTTKAAVAAAALEAGACIVNDQWGLQGDPDMARVVRDFGAGLVIMHNQAGTDYPGDLIDAVRTFFLRSLDLAAKAGIAEGSIVLDPGIGFGKTPAQNLEVVRRLAELNDLGLPLLLGASRKSFLGKILDLPPAERLEGTLASTTAGIAAGVDIVRIHDVLANARAAKVADAIYRG